MRISEELPRHGVNGNRVLDPERHQIIRTLMNEFMQVIVSKSE